MSRLASRELCADGFGSSSVMGTSDDIYIYIYPDQRQEQQRNSSI
jgi:hypothetical protein